jgi:hypothetical protein
VDTARAVRVRTRPGSATTAVSLPHRPCLTRRHCRGFEKLAQGRRVATPAPCPAGAALQVVNLTNGKVRAASVALSGRNHRHAKLQHCGKSSSAFTAGCEPAAAGRPGQAIVTSAAAFIPTLYSLGFEPIGRNQHTNRHMSCSPLRCAGGAGSCPRRTGHTTIKTTQRQS